MSATTSTIELESFADDRPGSSSARLKRSVFRGGLRASVAVLIFFVINQAAGLLLLDRLVDSDVENQTVGTVDQLLGRQKSIDVVMAGSSLVGVPLWELDNFDQFGQPHTSALALQDELNVGSTKPRSVFNFAVLAAMLSDQYLLVNKFLVGLHKPRCLLLGVAPRDLVDPRWAGPAHTLCFRRFVGWSELSGCDFFMRDAGQWLSFLVCRASPIYANRQKIQSKIIAVAERAIARSKPSPADSRKGLKEALQSTHLIALQPRIRERESQATAQFEAATRLLRVCNQRGIRVIVVNMPITETWLQVLSPGFFQRYRDQLHLIAVANHSEWLDLTDHQQFTNSDFLDETGHLNNKGAEKFERAVLPKIQQCLASMK